MKRLSVLLLAVSGALVALSPIRAQASAAVSFDFFYSELSSYGNWIDVDGYGYCFQPTVASGWRPYYDGGWVYTDDGWCWNTTEPWGWATYHYGRWANVRGCGWVWVPGYEWAPAWVSWRTSSSYIGWAPLPPEARWGGGGIRFGVSFGFDIGPSYYNFCSPRYFGYSNVGRYCAPWRNNVNIIQQTTNITNITNVVNNNTTIIRSGGPNYDFVRKNSDRPIRRAQIERVNNPAGLRKGGALKNDLRGDKLRVVSPKIANNKNAKPKQIAARASSKNVDRGWGDIKDPNRAKQLREDMKNEAQVAAKRPENRGNNATRPQNANAASANRPNQAGRNDNAAKTAANDRARTGAGLKPFLGQDGRPNQQARTVRKPEPATQNRQQTAGAARPGQKPQVQRPQQQNQTQQRTADARRKADSDAARRQQILREQAARQQTANRAPQQQIQRPPTQGQLKHPSRQPVQRPPQVGQRPPQRSTQGQRPPQNIQRPPQSRPQPQQQQRSQPQKKSDDRKKESRPSQPQFQQQRAPQFQQRPSQPQMQRPSSGGGYRGPSSQDRGNKRS